MRDRFGMQRFGTGSSYHGTPMIWPFEGRGSDVAWYRCLICV
jgi:hypothetical protein